jgi:hypothetical protein
MTDQPKEDNATENKHEEGPVNDSQILTGRSDSPTVEEEDDKEDEDMDLEEDELDLIDVSILS